MRILSSMERFGFKARAMALVGAQTEAEGDVSAFIIAGSKDEYNVDSLAFAWAFQAKCQGPV